QSSVRSRQALDNARWRASLHGTHLFACRWRSEMPVPQSAHGRVASLMSSWSNQVGDARGVLVALARVLYSDVTSVSQDTPTVRPLAVPSVARPHPRSLLVEGCAVGGSPRPEVLPDGLRAATVVARSVPAHATRPPSGGPGRLAARGVASLAGTVVPRSGPGAGDSPRARGPVRLEGRRGASLAWHAGSPRAVPGPDPWPVGPPGSRRWSRTSPRPLPAAQALPARRRRRPAG